VAYRHSEEHPFLGREIVEQREFSDFTARLIDEEIARILGAAQEKAATMLGEHRDKLDSLAAALEEKEVLDEFELEQLIGPPAYRQPSMNGQPGGSATAVYDAADGVESAEPIGNAPRQS
jgi:cell division protease FtsH